MFDFMFAIVALAAASGGNNDSTSAEVSPAPQIVAEAVTDAPAAPSSVIIGQGAIIGGNTLLEGVGDSTAPAALPVLPLPSLGPQINEAVIPAGLVADPQDPSGKFTTATEIKPIMDATKGSWIAVREFNGQDLLYVTHLWSWRCGLAAMAISINDEPMQNWPLPPCHMKYATPNAILEEDGLPYLTLRLGAVETVVIQVVFDDLTTDAVEFKRGDVLIP
ncbi:hypothetical protein [Sulfitobacter sp. SK012]|uniref:hypothetical protein n=1 Tax=Sulfitobacter sp. SK012 TaxID=1389005 RepID=UPI0020C7ECB4|nr:hypothetical protein [Sulfitobacter sp. SK012]